MKKFIFLFIFLLPAIYSFAQTDSTKMNEAVEVQPEYPGGMEAMYAHILKNMVYPATAKEAGVQGKVYVNFTVNEDGSVSNVKVIRGIGHGCDEEAARLVSIMPKWKPGTQHGKPIKVNYNIPIMFRLY